MYIKKIKSKIKSKKAVSLMVSYVLLIVIALALASVIYSWAKVKSNFLPQEECPEDVSIIIKDYSCNNTIKVISLYIENKGLFNINGFFIRASDNESIIASIPLNTTDIERSLIISGRYDFFDNLLKPNEVRVANFSFKNSDPLKKIEIQPYILQEKITLCPNRVRLNIDANKCN